MKILFIGDVVGAAATDHLAKCIPQLRDAHEVDLVVVNAENCAPNGLGMAAQQVDILCGAGADVITGGNHSWDSPESVDLLSRPDVVRPANVGDAVGGRGVLYLRVGGSEVTVVNLADACAMRSAPLVRDTFRPAYRAWTEIERRGTVLVDYHGDHVIEKLIFARAVDGEAAAVLGTHTHEATLAMHLLPGGTAVVCDVGMTGPLGGVQGFAHHSFVSGLKTTGNPFSLPLPPVTEGPISLGAVLLDVAGQRTRHITRIDESGRTPAAAGTSSVSGRDS